MLKELLQAEHLTQETVAEEAAMHRSTVSRILEKPSAANPQMVLRLAEALGLKKYQALKWFCTSACPVGTACHYSKYHEVSLAQSACRLYAAVTALNTRLANVLSIAVDDRVGLDEEKDFAATLEDIREVKQAISDMELWVYRNKQLLSNKKIASAATLTISGSLCHNQ